MVTTVGLSNYFHHTGGLSDFMVITGGLFNNFHLPGVI